jgi:hypothetical protein
LIIKLASEFDKSLLCNRVLITSVNIFLPSFMAIWCGTGLYIIGWFIFCPEKLTNNCLNGLVSLNSNPPAIDKISGKNDD